MNISLFLFFQQFAHQAFVLDAFFIFVAERLGWAMVGGTFLLPFLVRKQREKRVWFMIGLALFAAAFARLGPTELIRALYPVERPFVVLTEVAPLAEVISWQAPLVSHEPTPSFPSGHAALYFALATVLFFWNKKIGSVYYGAAALIAVSRVIAGIHWPLDILGGAAVGGATALLATGLFRKFSLLPSVPAPAGEETKILIVGGGFGGIRAAVDLAVKNLSNVTITLVSDKPHFEYTPALYRVVTGRSPLEVCIPLRDIVVDTGVEVLRDTIETLDVRERKLSGASGATYSFDFLILALGSETAYFDIPGLRELSFGFKSITEGLRLKRHLHEIFEAAGKAPQTERVNAARVVIVGGGASGCELAGELALYTRTLAQNHGLDPGLVTIDLIEAAGRLTPLFPAAVSSRIEQRLRALGVNVFLNRSVVKEEIERVYLKDMELKTKTVIWAAGVKPHHFFATTPEFTRDEKGRIIVDEFLQPVGFKNIFVVGDGAATPYTGLAQTALGDGSFVAEAIVRKILRKPFLPYAPKRPVYVMPIGPGWAVAVWGKYVFAGRLGWWLRRAADLRFFFSILPFRKALTAFRTGAQLSESCEICTPATESSA